MTWGISDSGVRFVEREEGCVLRVYRDSHGYPTAGVGHLVKPGDDLGPVGTPITQAQADSFFRADVAEVVAALNRFVTGPLNQNRVDALLSWAFNCGADILNTAHHTPIHRLNAGDIQGCADELLLFDVSGGVHDAFLKARRQRERALFLTPDGASAPDPHPLDLSMGIGVQRALNLLGWQPKLSEDGAFGHLSKAALMSWQGAHGLDDDGIPGPATRTALKIALAAIGVQAA